MLTETKRTDLFCEYYAKWITVYKKGAIRKVTMDKYLMTQKWLVKLIPNLRVCDMNRIAYQQLLNDYAEFHERQTTMDFHHQLKGAILDAVDEGLIERDPTRKAIIKGKPPVAKKIRLSLSCRWLLFFGKNNRARASGREISERKPFSMLNKWLCYIAEYP